VPDIMRAILEGRAVHIRSPYAIRPWQHVLEPLHGYLSLAERLWVDGPRFAQAWNFGPYDEDAKTVLWIVEHLARLWGEGTEWTLDGAQGPHESRHLRLDCSKVRSELGWAPKLHLATALDWIVEWYQGYQDGQDMRALTKNQIARFENLRAAAS
jgi:CDP-glucose 4,6-dehydratase